MSSDKPTSNPSPELSVILITSDGYEPLRRTIRALGEQTARDRLELLVVCPSREGFRPVESETMGLHSLKVLEMPDLTKTSTARVAAIHAATAPIIAVAEDHAYPEPRWAEAMIAAHRGPWAGVGPAFLNANPGIVSWVALVLAYGRWIDPIPPGVIDDIPGHNSSWKKNLLLEYGADLESMLTAPTLLNWSLRSKGYVLYLESAAKVSHLQASRLWDCLIEHFHVARLFPARRSRNWPWYRRLFYAVSMPVLLGRNVSHWIKNLGRVDPGGSILLKSWPFLFVAGVVWGLGEIVGYLFGIGSAEERTLSFDTHRLQYLNRRDREFLAVPSANG
jgi:hypothetical protein